MKRAILQVADTSPLESLVMMLREVGYKCYLPEKKIQVALRDLGCDTVLEIEGLVQNWGYEQPMNLPTATLADMDTTDLYVDVKAHRNGPLIWKRWPNLEKKTLWYRINGCEPEHVIRSDGFDCGDEINPPCPVLTPNQWYKEKGAWGDRAYTFWPPFYRFSQYGPRASHTNNHAYEPAMCLIHNLEGWGYGKLVPVVRELGVRCHGVRSPDGLLRHAEVRQRLKKTLALVHLKSSDAPGYALYEALATGTPVVITRRLIWRSRMEELFKPGVNCLVFDRETHDNLSDEDVAECRKELAEHLHFLSYPDNNIAIGEAGRESLQEIMWDSKSLADTESLLAFMRRHYGE